MHFIWNITALLFILYFLKWLPSHTVTNYTQNCFSSDTLPIPMPYVGVAIRAMDIPKTTPYNSYSYCNLENIHKSPPCYDCV